MSTKVSAVHPRKLGGSYSSFRYNHWCDWAGRLCGLEGAGHYIQDFRHFRQRNQWRVQTRPTTKLKFVAYENPSMTNLTRGQGLWKVQDINNTLCRLRNHHQEVLLLQSPSSMWTAILIHDLQTQGICMVIYIQSQYLPTYLPIQCRTASSTISELYPPLCFS